jgi:hypothetical protein
MQRGMQIQMLQNIKLFDVIRSSYEIVQRINSSSGTTLRMLIARQGTILLSVIMHGGMGLKQ